MTYIFRHTTFLSALSACIVGLCFADGAQAGPVVFDFVNNDSTGEFDGALAGATMTRDEGGAENSITIKSLQVKAPTYVAGVWDGVSYNTTISTTTIPGNDTLSIDNKGSNPPWGSDYNGIDPEESWTIEFSVPVVFNEIDFSSFTGGATGDQGLIQIDGVTVLNFNDADLDGSDVIGDPFGAGLVIPAGVDVTFQGVGDANDASGPSHWRIDSLTVTEAPSILKTLVHPDTGEVILHNSSYVPIDLADYVINSPLGALETGDLDWNSLADQNLDPVGGGDDPGETWQESGAISPSVLAEAFLLGSTTLDPYDSLSLGDAYDAGMTDENMTMIYFDREAGVALNGSVEIIVLGDMDGNGVLDLADVNPFVQALTDREAFEAANPGVPADFYGDFNGNGKLDLGDISDFKAAIAEIGTGSSSGSAVPEPSTIMLLGLAFVACVRGRNRI